MNAEQMPDETRGEGQGSEDAERLRRQREQEELRPQEQVLAPQPPAQMRDETGGGRPRWKQVIARAMTVFRPAQTRDETGGEELRAAQQTRDETGGEGQGSEDAERLRTQREQEERRRQEQTDQQQGGEPAGSDTQQGDSGSESA
jgi:hypothetical protein